MLRIVVGIELEWMGILCSIQELKEIGQAYLLFAVTDHGEDDVGQMNGRGLGLGRGLLILFTLTPEVKWSAANKEPMLGADTTESGSKFQSGVVLGRVAETSTVVSRGLKPLAHRPSRI